MSDRDATTALAAGLRTAGTVAGFTARVLWTALRVLAGGLAVGAAYLADPDRRARARRWLLLEANRWTLVALLVGAVFVATFLLAVVDVVGVLEPGFVTTMFSGIISGLFSFVPIVVAVNQLTVSRVFGSPGDHRRDIDSVDELRATVEALAGTGVSPTEPAPFVQVVVGAVTDRVAALERTLEDDDSEATAAVERYLAVVRAQCAHVEARLDDHHHRLIEVVLPLMDDSYSRNLNDTRRIRAAYGDDLPGEATDLLDEFEELFLALDVLRQYFKGLYIQQELSYLSRLVGYTGVGGFLVAVFLIMTFANGQPLAGHPVVLEAVVSLAVALATVPFAVLVSFVIRVAAITQRTAAPGAFTPRRETAEYGTHR